MIYTVIHIEVIAMKAEVKATAKQTAKVFMTGRSQAVRIPAEFRFKSKEVFIRRDEKTGEVILSPRLSWKEIFAGLDAAAVPDDFLSPEERDQGPPQEREEL
jgi:antitoxin VapB